MNIGSASTQTIGVKTSRPQFVRSAADMSFS
jgi:hypothetical protein